jgi:hypothetical protein
VTDVVDKSSGVTACGCVEVGAVPDAKSVIDEGVEVLDEETSSISVDVEKGTVPEGVEVTTREDGGKSDEAEVDGGDVCWSRGKEVVASGGVEVVDDVMSAV